MNKYTIYCTTEQTAKAYDLGANLFLLDKMQSAGFDENPYKDDYKDRTKLNIGLYAFCPTAEQMIGWLEEKGLFVIIHRIKNVDKTFTYVDKPFTYYYSILDNNCENISGGICTFKNRFSSLQKATLSAIDAALEYLTSKK